MIGFPITFEYVYIFRRGLGSFRCFASVESAVVFVEIQVPRSSRWDCQGIGLVEIAVHEVSLFILTTRITDIEVKHRCSTTRFVWVRNIKIRGGSCARPIRRGERRFDLRPVGGEALTVHQKLVFGYFLKLILKNEFL